MSHMHIPDGVLPLWLVFAGWIVTSVILYFSMRKVKKVGLDQKLPLIGIVSAIMIVGMTLEIVPIAYHVNLSVVAGIVLGPSLAFIAVFIVDLIISMFGHGGITVVGLNSLIVGAEAVLGFYIFRSFLGLFNIKRLSAGISSALATGLSLMVSTSFMIGIVYISQLSPGIILNNEGQTVAENASSRELLGGNERNPLQYQKIDVERFTKTISLLGIFGWTLESVITGLVIGYVFRVRPDLILSKVA